MEKVDTFGRRVSGFFGRRKGGERTAPFPSSPPPHGHLNGSGTNSNTSESSPTTSSSQQDPVSPHLATHTASNLNTHPFLSVENLSSTSHGYSYGYDYGGFGLGGIGIGIGIGGGGNSSSHHGHTGTGSPPGEETYTFYTAGVAAGSGSGSRPHSSRGPGPGVGGGGLGNSRPSTATSARRRGGRNRNNSLTIVAVPLDSGKEMISLKRMAASSTKDKEKENIPKKKKSTPSVNLNVGKKVKKRPSILSGVMQMGNSSSTTSINKGGGISSKDILGKARNSPALSNYSSTEGGEGGYFSDDIRQPSELGSPLVGLGPGSSHASPTSASVASGSISASVNGMNFGVDSQVSMNSLLPVNSAPASRETFGFGLRNGSTSPVNL